MIPCYSSLPTDCHEEPSMPLKLALRFILIPLLALVAAVGTLSRPENKVTGVRLYTLDCGRAELKDMSMFSDTGEYDGKSGAIAVSCFVIQHPKGTLVWDTGMGDSLAEKKDEVWGIASPRRKTATTTPGST